MRCTILVNDSSVPFDYLIFWGGSLQLTAFAVVITGYASCHMPCDWGSKRVTYLKSSFVYSIFNGPDNDKESGVFPAYHEEWIYRLIIFYQNPGQKLHDMPHNFDVTPFREFHSQYDTKVGAAIWGGACGGQRHCCIRWGSTYSNGKGSFHNGKCQCVADGEMFPIRMRKLHNISVRQTYRWKARFVGFWRYIQFQDQTWCLWEISKSVTIVLRNIRSTQQGCCRNMHIHVWTPRPTGPPRTATHAGCSPRPSPKITLGRLVKSFL